jgi:hypothetical protein
LAKERLGVARGLQRLIIEIFRKAVPANSKSRVYVELLGDAWRKDAVLRQELARELIRIAGNDLDSVHGNRTRPAFSRWVTAGIGQSLGPLNDLAWEAESQRQGSAWRARMIGGSSPAPEAGFLGVAKAAVLNRLQNALRFTARYDLRYRRGLAEPPLRFGKKAQDALGSAWIAVSSKFVADYDRPYRGEAALEMLEPSLFKGYFKKLRPEFVGMTLEQARNGYHEACMTGEEYPYRQLWDYHRLVKSGLSLVRAGDIRPPDLRLITRLGPPSHR